MRDKSRLKTNVKLIKGYMKENGMRVGDFCKFCNISKYAFYKLLNSNFSIRITIVYNISKATGISVDSMIFSKKLRK